MLLRNSDLSCLLSPHHLGCTFDFALRSSYGTLSSPGFGEVAQNATNPQSDFGYWDSAEQAIRFREALSPIVIRMEFRLAELENPARQHGIRLGQVATRQNAINELKRASIVMRAESYRRRLFSEFDRAKEMFLP